MIAIIIESSKQASQKALLATARIVASAVGTTGPSAVVAKLLSAFTLHGTTAIISFDPIIAFGTLFEFSPLNEA